MDVIERSKRLFADNLPSELVEEVETWDDYHQNFFWSYVYKRFQQIFDDRVLDEIIYGNANKRTIAHGIDVLSATHFRDTEDMIRPGKWFSDGNKRVLTRI